MRVRFPFEAARDNDLTSLGESLAEGLDANAADENGVTSLMYAAANGSMEAVTCILKCPEVDVNRRDIQLKTALMYSCVAGNVEVVRMLLRKGAKLRDETVKGYISLHYACLQGSLEVVKALVARAGAEMATVSAPASSVPAGRGGSESLVDFIDACNDDGRNGLMMTAGCGSVDIVKYLLENGASLDWTSSRGWRAEDYAREEGQSAVVQVIQEEREARLRKNAAWRRRGWLVLLRLRLIEGVLHEEMQRLAVR